MVCLRVQPSRGFSHHSSTKGVTTTAPTPSPSHHVLQMVPYFVHSANPDKASVVTPMVALMVVLTIPAKNANLNTSCALSKAPRPPAKRLTRYNPATPSKLFPMAIPTHPLSDPPLFQFHS